MVVEGGFHMVLQVELVGRFLQLPGDPAAWCIWGSLNKTELEKRPGWTQGKTNFC